MSMISDEKTKKWTDQMSISKETRMFMQQVFNKICTECELSAVEICAYLLNHTFDYFSVSDNRWVWVHSETLYWCIFQHWKLLQQVVDDDNDTNEKDDHNVNQVRLTAAEMKSTVFSAYLSCGLNLKSLCFYDYVSLIKIESKSEKHRSYLTYLNFVDTHQFKSFTQQIQSVEDIAVSVFSTTLARTRDTASKFWYD